jgi:nitrogen fixation/metabolism regulation signal transduction histidine kinase
VDCRYVELQVDDNGSGIDADMVGQLFEPYVTTKAKGTGLGLAIVKKIVEEHGGMIRAENRAEGGCRMVLRLPVRNEKTVIGRADLPSSESDARSSAV